MADANIAAIFYMHDQIPKSQKTVRRHVAHQGICIRSPREIPFVVRNIQLERHMDFAMECRSKSPKDNLYALGDSNANGFQDVKLKNRSCI